MCLKLASIKELAEIQITVVQGLCPKSKSPGAFWGQYHLMFREKGSGHHLCTVEVQLPVLIFLYVFMGSCSPGQPCYLLISHGHLVSKYFFELEQLGSLNVKLSPV